jgi:N-acyl-D-amino-acid deacylase
VDHDLIIRNGNVVDGSGGASYRADIGISGTKIDEIGRVRGTGKREFDATGYTVTPGFIDGHTHMDAQVFWDPLGRPSCWHGVTTAIMGHCGFTLAPGSSDERALVVRNLERAEDISAEAMDKGITWSWDTFPEYLDAVDALPKGINYVANVGHSALRTSVMGERAFEEPGSDDDIRAMESALGRALQAGAIGFSTSLSNSHETSDNRPVASRLSTWEEVRRLVMAESKWGGVFQLAPGTFEDLEGLVEFYKRLEALAIESGVTTFVPALGAGGMALLPVLDEAAAQGGRLVGLTHSRGIISIVISFETRLPFDRLAEWQPLRSLPVSEQRDALRDASVRESLVAAAHRGDYGRSIGAEARPPNYNAMTVFLDPIGINPTVAEFAARRGVDPVEAIIDLALETDMKQLFVQPVSSLANDEDAIEILKHPRTVMTFSDAGAHVSQVADSIQTHFLSYWVRERQVFKLEEAVRMLTSVPASAWGFKDRGILREGFAADLNIFDPDHVGPNLPTVTADLPGGSKRLEQTAAGFLATVVNGSVLIEDGEPTGAVPGKLLRRGRDT